MIGMIVVHIGQTFFRRLLDGETGFCKATENQYKLNPPAREGDELSSEVACRGVELLDDNFKPATLFEARLDLGEVRLRERVGAREDADLGRIRNRLKADVDHGLPGHARRGDRAVKDIAREWLADDRRRPHGVVGRDPGAADIIGRGRRPSTPARNDQHEDLVVLHQLLRRGDRLGGR